MKEEFEEEFVADEMLEATEEEILEELNEEEEETTEGGAFFRATRCRGTFRKSSYNRTEIILIARAGLGVIKRVERLSGPKIRWVPGVGNITIHRAESKLGLGRYRAYALNGDWVDINVTFK